ncbi:MAG: hypothetical protein ACE5KL_08390 [Alphaproteobacteria bacterium]
MKAKHYGVAARCEELRGKVLGFYAERSEAADREEWPSPSDLHPHRSYDHILVPHKKGPAAEGDEPGAAKH